MLPALKLYLVSRPEDHQIGYDETDSFVVAASDEATARLTHPSTVLPHNPYRWNVEAGRWVNSKFDDGGVWPISPEAVVVKEIGVAAEGVEPGVVIESFNAG